MSQHTALGMGGEYKVTRYDRETGAYLGESEWTQNAITTGGKTRFIDLCLGHSAQHFDYTSKLQISHSTGSKTISNTYLNAAPVFNSPESYEYGADVTWKWRDESSDSYAITTLRLLNGYDSLEFSNAAASSLGTKPSSQTWEYSYRITLSDNSGGNGRLWGMGLSQMLRLMCNAHTWGSGHMDRVHLEIYSAEEDMAANGEFHHRPTDGSDFSGYWRVPTGTVSLDYLSKTSTSMSFKGRMPAPGPGQTRSWYNAVYYFPGRYYGNSDGVKQNGYNTTDIAVCSRRTGLGIQDSTQHWDYTWTFAL